MNTLRLYKPVKPHIVNQIFGVNRTMYSQFGLIGHNGIDLFTYHGQPVYAAHDGICYTEIDNNQGHGVTIRTHEQYECAGQLVHFKTIYWHLEKSDAVVKTGQSVKAGDLIGYADNTGFSTGDHLHFGLKPQVWDNSSWGWVNQLQNNGHLGAIDPTPFFTNTFAEHYKIMILLNTTLVGVLEKLLARLKK